MWLHSYIAIVAYMLLSVAVAECYYPDGGIAKSLSPCNTTSQESGCCRESNSCLSNGFCFSSDLGTVVRRGCTDKTWNSTECPLDDTVFLQRSDAELRLLWGSEGFPAYAKWMASSDDLLVFRGFDELNVRMLLLMQDRIARKEQELLAGDLDAHNKYDQFDVSTPLLRKAQEKIMDELLPLLQQYNEYAASYSQIKSLRPAKKYQIENVQAWFRDYPTATKEEQDFVRNSDDLLSLVDCIKSPLRSLLETIQSLFTLQVFQSRQDDQIQQVSTSCSNSARLDSVVAIVFVVLGILLLLGPLWILQFMRNNTKRLGVITAFILLFTSLIASATVAKPFEILASTAAYATVLTVFLQVKKPVDTII